MHLKTARNVALALVLGVGMALPAQPAQASTLIRGRSTACATTNSWSPKAPTVGKGAKVVWKAVCGSHTVTAWGGNWSKNVVLGQGQTTSKTFKSKGVFRFRCTFHSALVNGKCSGMCGRVTVT